MKEPLAGKKKKDQFASKRSVEKDKKSETLKSTVSKPKEPIATKVEA